MRVCQVLAGDEEGGLEKHTIELSYALQKEGIDVTVIAHEKFKNDFKTIRFIPIDLSTGRNNIFTLFKIYKVLKKENFDLIHTQANKATTMIAKLKPFITMKLVSTLHSYKKNIKPFYHADYVITVSTKIGEKLHMKNKITIYNGLALEESDYIDLYEKYDISRENFIICSVGRLSEVKRFDILISSLEYLEDVHLILVGEGREDEKLMSLAKSLNVSEKVTFTGVLENKKAKEVMKSSHLFILTSDKEGFPYVLIETLFNDTPILSTDVSDIRQIIGEKYIIPFDDKKALATKILEIKGNYADTVEEFELIFKSAKEEFTLSNMTQKTIEIYEKVLV